MVTTVQKIGRYEIVSELGRGAMGLVYRAIDPNIGRTVALKTMRLDVHGIEHDDMLRRFKYEARAAGLMNHPNIVTIYDADEVDGLFYIAMEYLEGHTLQTLMLEKRVVPTEQIVEVARQVAMGLDYAHQMRVIHRDIKPANIMITPQNVSKIMDFGISKVAGSKTNTSQVLGTPNYMSPEQVKGVELDGRADLFSFGVVLYEMATGERPFPGDNVTTIIYKIVSEQPVPPSEKQMGVHPGLSAIISMCLEKNPAHRYQTGAELARALENYRSIGGDDEATSVLPAAPLRSPLSATGMFAPAVRTQAVGSQSGAAAAPALAHQTGRRTAAMSPGNATQRGKTSTKPFAVVMVLLVLVLGAAGIYAAKHRRRPLQAINTQPQAAASAVAQNSQNGAPAAVPPSQTPHSTQPAVETEAEPKAVVKKAAERVPEKAQTPGKVEIRFTSSPGGAFVQIDGKSNSEWLTPFTMPNLIPGNHQVVFTKSGYSTETRSLEIGPKNSSYHIDLVPVTTAIALASDPAGASIEVDGRETGKVTPAQIPVSEGDHRVILRLDGYRSAQTVASVDKGQVFSFSPTLNPADARQAGNTNPVTTRLGKIFGGGIRGGKGMIDFVTTPPGAKIFIQGRPMAFATPAHVPIPEGDYRVEFREPGYKPVQQNVHVEAGKNVRVSATLDPR
ncbi:MAG: serine/threonine protein kinase [Acidobacteria bacterium]|nr:serine/threonine protein kinase [Acidobacteriota bacterium]